MEEDSLKKMLKEGAGKIGAALDDRTISMFLVYLKELKRWNRSINLASTASDRDIISRHFIDSLLLLRPLRDLGLKNILDIGSGAGFPGLPLKIADSGLEVVLMDSVGKKVFFMRHIIRTLGLVNITAVHSHAGDPAVSREYGGYFDCVTSRALSGLKEFLDMAMPFCRKGGVVIAMKGPSVHEELKALNQKPLFVTETVIPFSGRVTVLAGFEKRAD